MQDKKKPPFTIWLKYGQEGSPAHLIAAKTSPNGGKSMPASHVQQEKKASKVWSVKQEGKRNHLWGNDH
jgi:hypothetical protein